MISPLQNRVDPWGALHAVPSKAGTLMGNRGTLHDDHRNVVRRWERKAWVACDPGFKGIDRRPLFRPGRYSELFFLDEATALAAGHRPCNYCQRERFQSFVKAWYAANVLDGTGGPLFVKPIDDIAHAERFLSRKGPAQPAATLASLPDGVMVDVDGAAHLWHSGRLASWSHAGYVRISTPLRSTEVQVITPASFVNAIRAGFTVRVHPSLQAHA